MNSITKLISDLRRKSADMDNGMFTGSVSNDFFDGRRDGYRIAADMVEAEFFGLIAKVREAEAEIIEKEIAT